MPNYVITESVGNRVERVNSYRDLEKHHPSSGREAGREYRTIDGELEEVRTRNRTEPHVKKDFIIDPPTIPAPASGTIRVLNDDWNTVQIVDDNGRVLAQSLHMARGSQPANGSRIEYGQPMGRMGDVGSPGSVHAHVEAPAAVFERYINDITSGRIQSNGAARPGTGAVNADPMADGVLKHGERGDAVTRLQTALNSAGIRDENGQPLPTTGYFGDKTEAAVRKYQEQRGLEVDGKAGNDTLTALGLKQGTQPPRPQSADPQPQQTPQPQTPQAQTPQPQTPANPDAKANFAASEFLKSQSPEVRAYLDLVAWKEVHQSLNADGSPAGYRERNGVAGSRGLMPESAIADNGTLPRDELRYNVGRYQMKQVDVDDMRKRYDGKIDDFSPESQDRIAVAKMNYRGVMAPLQNGDIRTAIERGGKEWASLPGSPYGQVQAGYTVDKAVDYYNERLAFHRALDRGQTPPARTENGATPGQSGGIGDTLLLKEERGEGVRRLQDALNKAGIRDENGQPLPTTGYFGDKTEAAVRRYQEQKGLEVDGKAGENTLKALGIFPGQQQTPTQPKADTPTPAQPEQVTPQPTQPRADTPTQPQPTQPQPTQPQPNAPQQPDATIPANVAASEGILQQGSTGPEVAKLQTMLNNQGFRGPDGQPIPTHGTFDAATTHALKAFEKDNGMDPNGIAGPKTLEALSKAEQSPKLSSPNHPDNGLYQQAMKGLEQMPAGTFKNAQERENAAATIAFEAKVSGLSQIDHVKAGGNNAGFFAVQGGLEDPTNKRVYVDREQAVQQTVQQSTQLMQQNTQNQPQAPAPAQDTTQQRENTQRGALLA